MGSMRGSLCRYIEDAADYINNLMSLSIKITKNRKVKDGNENDNSKESNNDGDDDIIVLNISMVIMSLVLILLYLIISPRIRRKNDKQQQQQSRISTIPSDGYAPTDRGSQSTITNGQMQQMDPPPVAEVINNNINNGNRRTRENSEATETTVTPRSSDMNRPVIENEFMGIPVAFNAQNENSTNINQQQQHQHSQQNGNQNQQSDQAPLLAPVFPFLKIRNMLPGVPTTIHPNLREPVPISSDLIDGKVFIMLRTKPEDPYFADYFHGKRRVFEIRVQAKLKRTPKGTLFFGGEVPKKMQLGLIANNLCKGVLSVVRSLAPALHASMGTDARTSSLSPSTPATSSSSDDTLPDLLELPHLMSPLHSIAERLVITPPGQTPPPFGLMDIPESEEEIRKRVSARGSGVGLFVKDCTITFSFISAYLDVVTWKLRNLGVFNSDLSLFWGEMPLIVSMYEAGTDKQPNPKIHSPDEKKYYLRFEITNTARMREMDDTPLVIFPQDRSHLSFSSRRLLDQNTRMIMSSANTNGLSASSSSFAARGSNFMPIDLDQDQNFRLQGQASHRSSALSNPNSEDDEDEESSENGGSRSHNDRTNIIDDDATFADNTSVSVAGGAGRGSMLGSIRRGGASNERFFRPPREIPERSKFIIRVPAWLEYQSRNSKKQSVAFIVVVSEIINNDAKETPNINTNQSSTAAPLPIKWVVIRRFEEFTHFLDPVIGNNVAVKKKFFLSASESIKKNQQLFEAQRQEIEKYCKKLPPLTADSKQLRWLSVFSERDESLFTGASQFSSSLSSDSLVFSTGVPLAAMSTSNDHSNGTNGSSGNNGNSNAKSSLAAKLEIPGQVKCLFEAVILRATWETHWREEHALICGSLLDGSKYIIFYIAGSKSPSWVVSSKIVMSIRPVYLPKDPIATSSPVPNIPGVFLEIETFSRIFLICFANMDERSAFLNAFDTPIKTSDSRGSSLQDSPISKKFRADQSASFVPQSIILNDDDPFRSAIKETRRWGQKYLVLNCRRVIFPSHVEIGSVPMYQDPCKVAERVLKVALNTTQNSKLEDLILLFDSAVELRHIILNDAILLNNARKTAFFLNIYHAMLLHSRILLSQPATMMGWGSFGAMISWEIGCGNNAMIFSLSMIEHTILRAATSSPLMDLGVSSVRLHPGTEADYCKMFALTERDPRINFALNPLTLSTSPDIVVFESDKLNQQFEQVTKSFIERFVKINIKEKEIKLHRLFRWYRDDFSSLNSVHETIQYILPYMPTSERQALIDSFDSKGRTTYKIKYASFDWTPRPYILERRTNS